MSEMAPMCVFCKHYREENSCDAFPEGIPDEIKFGLPLPDVPEDWPLNCGTEIGMITGSPIQETMVFSLKSGMIWMWTK